MPRKTYAIVGTGGRSDMFSKAIQTDYADIAEIVALCDTNQSRMNYYNSVFQSDYGKPAVPTYLAHEFDRMIEERRPDVVIVTSIDRTHHTYICRAMELGCDVISEKPMTTDAAKCQQVIDTKKRTGRNLTVTFNYRYTPASSKVKEFLQSGAVGEIFSVHFEWSLDTSHGADYFRRWHRDKNNSGGLLVHKSTHHFDVVSWWLDSGPETVYAMGDLRFYGRENAEKRGVSEFYSRARGSKVAETDPFALKYTGDNKTLNGLYYDAEHEDGYYRDQSVFGDGISIEDTMAVMIRFRNKTMMTYSLNAHCPWEGLRIVMNGSKGRLVHNVVHTAHNSKDVQQDFGKFGMHEVPEEHMKVPAIVFQPHWGKPMEIPFTASAGGHGGGDPRLLHDIFSGDQTEDPLHRAAGYVDGVNSIMCGIAANESIRTGMPVRVDDLVTL